METKCLWSSAIWLHSFHRKCILMAGVMEATNGRYSCAWCQPGPKTPIIFLCNHTHILAKLESQEQLQHQLLQLLSHSYNTFSFQERLWNNSFLQNDTSWPAEVKNTIFNIISPHLCRTFLQQVSHWSRRVLLCFLIGYLWRGRLGFYWYWGGPSQWFWCGFLVHGCRFLPSAEEGSSHKNLRFGFQAAERDGDCFLGLNWLRAAGRGCGCSRCRFSCDTVGVKETKVNHKWM